MSRWGNDEIEFLKENYALYGVGFCAEKLNKTCDAVKNKAQRLELKRDGNKRYQRHDTPHGYVFCGMCDQVLPESFFYKKTKTGSYGKKTMNCRSCCQKKARHHYGKNKWTMFERRKKDPIHFMFNRLRASAKKRNIFFDITEDQLRKKFNTHCPIYKEELVFFSNSDWSPSVDRIDSDIGYIESNIVVVSKKANVKKNSCSVNDLKLLYDFYSSLTPPIE
jgi:hypothetical protein